MNFNSSYYYVQQIYQNPYFPFKLFCPYCQHYSCNADFYFSGLPECNLGGLEKQNPNRKPEITQNRN